MKEATDRVCFAAEARATENEGGDRSTKCLWPPCEGQLCAGLVVKFKFKGYASRLL
jgi:hypothetical protein